MVVLKRMVVFGLLFVFVFHRNNGCIETHTALNEYLYKHRFHRNNGCIETLKQYDDNIKKFIPPKQWLY